MKILVLMLIVSVCLSVVTAQAKTIPQETVGTVELMMKDPSTKSSKIIPVVSGSCVSVAEYCLATVSHVVKEGLPIFCKIQGKRFQVTIAGSDPVTGLVYLVPKDTKISGSLKYATFPADDSKPVVAQSPVECIGYAPQKGVQSRAAVLEAGAIGEADVTNHAHLYLTISAPPIEGNSGGGVFDHSGTLIGIVLAGLGKETMCIPVYAPAAP